jgi:exosome complex RNA-binding protein Rrp4
MTSIKTQTQIDVLEHHVVKINHRLAEFQQVVDLLTAKVESMAREDEVKVKGSVHGKSVRRGGGTARTQVKSEAPF